MRGRLHVALLAAVGGLVVVALAVSALVSATVRPVHQMTLRTPAVLDTVEKHGREVMSAARALRSVAPDDAGPCVWLGETGSAQVGGQPGVCGCWAASLWWLDQLGLLARLGHSVQCRQTLTGSDYGLLDETTLDPRPDFWASVLWKRLMGVAVFEVSAATSAEAPKTLRLYCHGATKAAAAT